jgi:hypothetical protein
VVRLERAGVSGYNKPKAKGNNEGKQFVKQPAKISKKTTKFR